MNTEKSASRLPMILLISFLVVSLAISIFFAVKFNLDLSSAWNDVEDAEALVARQAEEIDSLSKDLIAADNEISGQENTISELEVTISGLENTIKQNEEDSNAQAEEINQLLTEKAGLEDSLNDAEEEIDNYLCNNQLTLMNYDDILVSSNHLAAFMLTYDDIESTSYTFRNTVWNNAMSKIHGVNYVSKEDGNVYSMQFLVYYDEFNFEEGTFLIDGQCWVDSPYD